MFDAMPSWLGAGAGAALHVQVSHIIYPVTNKVLYQVYDIYGAEELHILVVDAWRVEALVWFRARGDAEKARGATHGRNIYDGGCLLEAQHAQPCSKDGAVLTPTKCSTPVPSCAITKSDAESTPTTLEHVFPATMSQSMRSAASAAAAPPVSLTATKEDEADMDKSEMKPEETFQELCAKMIAMLNNMLVTCESTASVDITRVVAVTSTNTESVPNTLEVRKEANSISLVDTNESCMATPTKCLTKGNKQMINDDDDDMATEDLVEHTEVNSKFTLLQTSFNNPWFGHQAISVVYLTCYSCLDRSSEYTARSPPVPRWRAVIPWNQAEMTFGSRPLPRPDPQLSQGSEARGGEVSMELATFSSQLQSDRVEHQPQPWPNPQLNESSGDVVYLLQRWSLPDLSLRIRVAIVQEQGQLLRKQDKKNPRSALFEAGDKTDVGAFLSLGRTLSKVQWLFLFRPWDSLQTVEWLTYMGKFIAKSNFFVRGCSVNLWEVHKQSYLAETLHLQYILLVGIIWDPGEFGLQGLSVQRKSNAVLDSFVIMEYWFMQQLMLTMHTERHWEFLFHLHHLDGLHVRKDMQQPQL